MFASGEPMDVSTTAGAALAGDALRGSGGQSLAAQHILGTPSLFSHLYTISFLCLQ
jgi:hypothetical protein